jgi:glycosyltransferase involved in cell wall biosynthesis
MIGHKRIAVIHVALNPVTGPLSVMRALANAQIESGLYSGVALGLIVDKDWLNAYETETDHFGVQVFRSLTPNLPGTISFVWQRFRIPPIEFWIRDLAEQTRAETVIVHFHNAWLSGVFLPLKCSFAGVVTVATFHGFAGERALRRQPIRRGIHRWMAGRLLRYGSRLTSVDRGNLEAIEEVLALPANRFAVIGNGLPQRERLKLPYVSGANEFTVGQIGTLNEGKGWRIAVDAVRAIRQNGVDIKLIIAGDGPDADIVRKLAGENPEWLNYLGPVQEPLLNVFPRLDILMLPTHTDGLPMVILEAMCCGIPVISTRVGGIPDLISDNETGCLCERSSKEFQRCLTILHSEPQLLDSMGRKAHEKFGELFNIDAVANQYDGVYRKNR